MEGNKASRGKGIIYGGTVLGTTVALADWITNYTGHKIDGLQIGRAHV